MVGCCPCCGGRQPRDGAGKYAAVEQDDLDEAADYCDDAPQVEGLDDPFAALQALRHLDFDADNNSDGEGGADGTDDRPAGAACPGTVAQEAPSRRATVPQSSRRPPEQLNGEPNPPPAQSVALKAEAGRRGLTIGDMEIDIGWRKPAPNEVLSAAAARARSLAGASGGSPSKTKPHAKYGRGQQHPASMRQLIGGGTAHPESMTRQLKMQFDPAAGGMKGRMSSWRAKVEAKGKEAIEKAKEKTRTSGVT
jgi:hypothetical protein